MRNVGGRVGIAVTITPFTLADGSVYSMNDVNFLADQGCWAGKLCKVLVEQYNSSQTPPASPNQTSSPTQVLDPEIKYLYVLGTGGGGGGGMTTQDNGSSGGGGGASIHVLTGYTIPAPLQGTPFQVKTGCGGAGAFNPSSSPGNNPGTDGGATEILLNGSPALVLGGGSAGVSAFTGTRSGGSVSTPNLTRLSPFPSNNEATGGTGGGGAVRNGDSSDTGGNNSGRGTGGGGGGGANVEPRTGANGGDASGSDNSVTYNINQQGLRSYTFTNPFPIVVSGCAGTGSVTGNLAETNNGPASYPNPNTGGGGKAGGGLKAVTAGGSPSDKFHGGGGGGAGGGMPSSGPYPQANMKGAGGGGYIIVIGSSFELVSGVNY